MRILIIEDEQKLAKAIKRALELQHYAVDAVFSGDEGYDLAIGENSYDLIISDLMMPGMDGIEVCKKIRQEGIHTPVLLLTAKGQIQDKVQGLDSGADDYMVKPFSFDELFARVRALIRRPSGEREATIELADLQLDPVNCLVTRHKQEIPLSSREYALLEYLLRNKEQVISKQQLIDHVWDYEAEVLPGTVEVHIKHIRDKVDTPFDKKLIHTVRGFGYILKEN